MCQDLIAKLVSAKQFISWGEASRTVLGKAFRPTDSNALIKAFGEAMPGADALLVDGECKYSYRAPVEKHVEWLKAQGYTVFPEVKEQVSAKKVKDSRLFSAKPVEKEASDLAKEVAELKAMLTALVAKAA